MRWGDCRKNIEATFKKVGKIEPKIKYSSDFSNQKGKQSFKNAFT
jgi:hypothetical protein